MITSWFHAPAAALAAALATLACASPYGTADAPARASQPASASISVAAAPSADARSLEEPNAKKADDTKKADGTTKPEDAKPAKADGKTKVEVGKPALDFTLKDLEGREQTLSSFRGKVVVLEWFSPGCPTCQWAYTDGPLVTMPERLSKNGVVWLTINSEDPAHKPATLEANKKFADAHSMKAPILLDPTGAVGRSYGAKTTPHMYVIDKKGVLVYRGALDNAPFGKVDGEKTEKVNYVDAALADLAASRAVANAETRSYG